ncbi:MAG: hypothetical protein KAS30_02535, partial [Candidatus Diapherotrites archaeon]|nr:hypothetical protein [Candidatus Diapherotrites archaeon]
DKEGLLGVKTGTVVESRKDYVVNSIVASPELKVEISSCHMSVNFREGLGEVTDVVLNISNKGQATAHNVSAKISASDQSQEYKNSKKIGDLMVGQSIQVKLIADTEYQQDTLITASVTSQEGAGAEIQKQC